jgi:hypothetical protein
VGRRDKQRRLEPYEGTKLTGTRIWTFRNSDVETGVTKKVGCKKDPWKKVKICMINYKENLQSIVTRNESEAEIHLAR